MLCATLESVGASPTPDAETIRMFTDMGYATTATIAAAIEAERACAFLYGAHSKYYKVLDELNNGYLRTKDGYPKTS